MTTPNQPSVAVDLVADGVLWLINRVVFHPRGFALGYSGTSWCLFGDGREPWRYEAGDDPGEVLKFEALESLLDRARYPS